MAGRGEAVPLTEFQLALLSTLTAAPNDDRYIAGGAALHFSPTSARHSDDLDSFTTPKHAWQRLLDPIDLAINKVLALAGRDESRDFVDVLFVHRHELPLFALVWAAVEAAASFASERPPGEIGCLYYSTPEARFVVPRADMRLADQGVQVHFGAPGGVLPQLTNASIEAPD